MIVSVIQPARADADLSDITSKEIVRRGYVTVDGEESYEVQFAVNLTVDEVAKVKRRLTYASNVEEALVAQAGSALATNKTFYESTAPQLVAGADSIIAAPTLTQANIRSLAQGIKALANQLDAQARQTNVLIRLQLRELDTTD